MGVIYRVDPHLWAQGYKHNTSNRWDGLDPGGQRFYLTLVAAGGTKRYGERAGGEGTGQGALPNPLEGSLPCLGNGDVSGII